MSLDISGDLLVSEELSEGQGRILQIDSKGHRRVLMEGLSKPISLLQLDGGHAFAFSLEGSEQPVSRFADGQITSLFTARNVQGVWADRGVALYAVENRLGDGRMLRFDCKLRKPAPYAITYPVPKR